MPIQVKKVNQFRTDIIVPQRDGSKKVIVAKVSKIALANIQREAERRERKKIEREGKEIFAVLVKCLAIYDTWIENRKFQDQERRKRKLNNETQRQRKNEINQWLLDTTEQRTKAIRAAKMAWNR